METNDKNIQTVKDFMKFVKKEIGINKLVPLTLLKHRPKDMHITTAAYMPGERIWIYIKDRHLADCLRSLAHELVHHHQHENDNIPEVHQDIGGKVEDDANAIAGQLIKKFAQHEGRSDIYEHIKKSGNLLKN